MKNLAYIFICLALVYFISNSEAKPEPSPAGGGYLEFNSDDDFLSTVKPWLPDEKLQTLTLEGWVYLESIPEADTRWSLIGQEDRFEIAMSNTTGWGNSFGALVYGDNNIMCACSSTFPGLPLEEWTHFIVWYSPTVSYGYNGSGLPIIKQDGFIFASSSPLRIGGIVPSRKDKCHFIGSNAFFRGYIDEVRILGDVRWELDQGKGTSYKIPKGKFTPDEDTICLWHFDEESEINGYRDSSGNGWTLWKNEAFDVKPDDKLYTLWGKLKSK